MRYRFSGVIIKDGRVIKIHDPKKFVFEPLHVCIDLNSDGVYSLENEVLNIGKYEKLIHNGLALYATKHKKHGYKECSGKTIIKDIKELIDKNK